MEHYYDTDELAQIEASNQNEVLSVKKSRSVTPLADDAEFDFLQIKLDDSSVGNEIKELINTIVAARQTYESLAAQNGYFKEEIYSHQSDFIKNAVAAHDIDDAFWDEPKNIQLLQSELRAEWQRDAANLAKEDLWNALDGVDRDYFTQYLNERVAVHNSEGVYFKSIWDDGNAGGRFAELASVRVSIDGGDEPLITAYCSETMVKHFKTNEDYLIYGDFDREFELKLGDINRLKTDLAAVVGELEMIRFIDTDNYSVVVAPSTEDSISVTLYAKSEAARYEEYNFEYHLASVADLEELMQDGVASQECAEFIQWLGEGQKDKENEPQITPAHPKMRR